MTSSKPSARSGKSLDRSQWNMQSRREGGVTGEQRSVVEAVHAIDFANAGASVPEPRSIELFPTPAVAQVAHRIRPVVESGLPTRISLIPWHVASIQVRFADASRKMTGDLDDSLCV
jgi:hypothetical protein